MLTELVNRIAELAVKADGPKLIHPTAEPQHVYAIQQPDGTLAWEFAEPQPRNHKAADLTAIVDFTTRETIKQGVEDAEVWYSRKGVTAFLDSTTRRDQVTLPLTASQHLTRLIALETVTWMDQKQFIRLLRIDLAGACPSLLPIVRQVRFKVATDGASSIQHGRASIGKSMQAELAGEGTIPEDVTLYIPVFDGFLAAQTFPVACAIEIDAENSRLALIPLPGAIEYAVRAAEDFIGALLHDMLGDAEVPVLYGTP